MSTAQVLTKLCADPQPDTYASRFVQGLSDLTARMTRIKSKVYRDIKDGHDARWVVEHAGDIIWIQ